MNKPHAITSAAPETAPLPLKTAARYLGISDTPLRKALKAGLLPDLTLATIGNVSTRDILEGLVAENGEPIPVIRLGQLADADQSVLPLRPYTGFTVSMSDDDFFASGNRWWPASGRDLILAAGAALLAHGNFVVGFMDVAGVREFSDGLYWYEATLVARLDGDAVAGQACVLDPNSPNAKLAESIMGLRLLGGGGGSITTI